MRRGRHRPRRVDGDEQLGVGSNEAAPVLAEDGLGGGDAEHGCQERNGDGQPVPRRPGWLGEPEQCPRPGVPPVDHCDERERHEAGENDQRSLRGEEVERHQ